MTLAAPSLDLRPAPDGLPAADLEPPVVAETGDPFAALRVIDLVAQIRRGSAVRIDDLVDGLNARHLGWLFDRGVVVDALLQLQSNWRVDYRSSDGIAIEDGPTGPTVAIEDSSRVDPWIVGQARRTRAECEAALLAFSRRDRVTGE